MRSAPNFSRYVCGVCASVFGRALCGSSLLHVAALAGLVVWASTAHQIPGGGGRGGMKVDLSTGDGAPSGPLKLEVLGDPNSLPEIKPWTKNVASSEVAVAAPPSLTEISAPPGTKNKTPRASNSAAVPPSATPPEAPDPSVTISLPAPAEVVNSKSPDSTPQAVRNAASADGGGGSPSFVGNLPPRYPDVAIENRWEGDVTLLLHIDTRGRVFNVEILHGSGHPLLDDEAAAAIRHWIGKPANRGGVPVESTAQLPVHFRLK